jgi:hypothetical protein
VLLDAVRQFVTEKRKLFDTPPESPVSSRVRVAGSEGQEEVTVSAPPAGAPWRWGREQPIDGLRRQDRDALVNAFVAAREAEGVPAEKASSEGLAAAEMADFMQHTNRQAGGWTPEIAEEFLLRYYPADGYQVGDHVSALPEQFEAVLGWLAATGRGAAEPLEAARARVGELRARFVEAAGDIRRFSPRKRLTIAMHASGVDLSDPKAVKRFMDAFRRRAAADPSLLKQLQPKAARWTWSGEGEPPDPQAACPCGSGRRYRKCCMPR